MYNGFVRCFTRDLERASLLKQSLRKRPGAPACHGAAHRPRPVPWRVGARGRRGGREHNQDRPLPHPAAGDRLLRERLPRPDLPHHGTDQQVAHGRLAPRRRDRHRGSDGCRPCWRTRRDVRRKSARVPGSLGSPPDNREGRGGGARPRAGEGCPGSLGGVSAALRHHRRGAGPRRNARSRAGQGTNNEDPGTNKAKRLTAFRRERGLVVLVCGTLGNNIRMLMPLTITHAEVARGLTILEEGLAHLSLAGAEDGRH